MTHSSWGNPGVDRGNLTRITGVGGLPLYVRSDVAPIHQALANKLHGMRKPGAAPLASAGGYNYRKIAGSSSWSNHAWALAVDYNPSTNPYQRGPLVTDFKADEVRRLVSAMGVRWGGDYSGKKDAMHFEVIVSKSEALGIARKVKSGILGTGAAKAPVFGVGAKGAKVREIEIRLFLLGYDPGEAEGVFDISTQAAVEAFQKANGLDVDGLVGGDTLKALEMKSLPLKADQAKDYVDILKGGDRLLPGGELFSKDGKHNIALQIDGNVTANGPKGAAWQTMLRGNELAMQTDGNLVLYVKGRNYQAAAWHTNTGGNPGAYLAAQNDGNIVIYSAAGKPLWQSNTAVK